MPFNGKNHNYLCTNLIKSSCTAKTAINRVKRRPKKWGKVFANYMSDMRLIFKIYEELNSKKKKKPDFRIGKEYE